MQKPIVTLLSQLTTAEIVKNLIQFSGTKQGKSCMVEVASRLIAVTGFALIVATSAQAVTPVPIPPK
jgi:hypothetical protein